MTGRQDSLFKERTDGLLSIEELSPAFRCVVIVYKKMRASLENF